MPRTINQTERRRGYSLLELVLAVALVGGTLAPALALIRDGIELSRKVDQRQLLANYAVQQLERRMAIAAEVAQWTDLGAGPDSGPITDTGVSSVRYQVSWVDELLGGDPDRLLLITAIAYIDEDGDGALDADEPQSTYTTKVTH